MSQERIVVLDDWTRFWSTQPAVERLRGLGEVVIYDTPARGEADVVERLHGASVAIANRERTPLDGRVLRQTHNLRLLAQTGRISPNVDAEAATERGIALVAGGGLPGSHVAVAELGLALLLALVRQIPSNDRRARQGDWAAPPTRMLSGLTLGIVGLGNIGGHMARLGQALQMQVVAWGPTLTTQRAAERGVERLELPALLQQADVVFVSTRLSDLTRGLLGAPELALMKPGSYLINIARGPIVDQQALVEALQHGHLAGAGLDVFDEEPLPPSSPLARLDNVVLTPHVGWGTDANFARMVENVADAVVRFLQGDTSHVLNPAALARPAAAAGGDA